jgi:hypothetical protein
MDPRYAVGQTGPSHDPARRHPVARPDLDRRQVGDAGTQPAAMVDGDGRHPGHAARERHGSRAGRTNGLPEGRCKVDAPVAGVAALGGVAGDDGSRHGGLEQANGDGGGGGGGGGGEEHRRAFPAPPCGNRIGPTAPRPGGRSRSHRGRLALPSSTRRTKG